MRVALDGRFINDHNPGIGRYAYELARWLPVVAPGDDFVLLTGSERNSRFGLAEIESLPNVQTVRARSSPRGLAQEAELRSIIRQYDVDVYHSPCHFMPYTLSCTTAATIHDVIPLVRPEALPSPKRVIYSALLRLTALRATRLAVDSQTTLDDLGRLVPNALGKAERVYLGVGTDYQPRSQAELESLRALLRLPPRYLLHVGTDRPHKNLDSLLRAWALLDVRERASTTLVLAGYHHPDGRLEALCHSLEITDSVRHIEAVPEHLLPLLYQAARLFVFPSLYEGFGLPVLEAMAMGTPVACSRRSSLPEVAGDAAELFDPDDPGDIARAMRALLTDDKLHQQLSARGLLRAKEFTWKHTATQMMRIYQEALGAL